MGEISVWHKGQPKQIGGVSHKTSAAAIVGFVLSEGLWSVPAEQARRSGRCYALFENWRGCQRLIPPWKRIYKLWKLWGLERIHVKFFVRKVAMETLIRKDFEEYVEVSQLKTPKRHVALRMEPHAVPREETAGNSSDNASSSSLYDVTGLFVIDDADGGGNSSPGARRKRSLVNRVVRQNERLREISQTVDDVDEEILYYEAMLHHCRVVEGGKDYVQEAYLVGDEGSGARPATKCEQQNSPPGSTGAISTTVGVCHNSETTEAPATSSDNPIVERESKNGLGNGNRTAADLGTVTPTRTDSNQKTGAKVVVVNPLPRNGNPREMEVGRTPTEEGTVESRDTNKEGGVAKNGIIATPKISQSSESAAPSIGPMHRNSLRAQKRHDRYGGRVKKRGPGLHEFEQSFEWMKVMDKEMRRLESIENLSFVDWDSESLLSDKDLTFYGGRKYKFRPALSGRSGRSRTVCRNDGSDSQIEKVSSNSEDALHGVSIDESKNPPVSILTGADGIVNRKCATVDPVVRTDAQLVLPKSRNHPGPMSEAFGKKIVDNRSQNTKAKGSSKEQMTSPSRSVGTTARGPRIEGIPVPSPCQRQFDKSRTTGEADYVVGSGHCVDGSKCCDQPVNDTRLSLDTYATGNAQWQLPNLQAVGDDVPTPVLVGNSNARENTGTNQVSDKPHNTKPGICRVPKVTKRVSFLVDQISNLGPTEISTRAPHKPRGPGGNNQVTGAVPRHSLSSVSTPVPVPRHKVHRSANLNISHPQSSMSHPRVKTDAANLHSEQNDPAGSGVSSSVDPVIPHPQSSPVTVRRVPKPPVYYSTEDSSLIRYHSTIHSVAKDPSKVAKSQHCTIESSVTSTCRTNSNLTPVHPRVGELRNGRPKGGFSLTPADYTKVSTKAEPYIQSVIEPPPQSGIVGVVTCPVNEDFLKAGQNIPVLPTVSVCLSQIKPPLAFREGVTASNASPKSPRVRSPDQGLGSEIVSPRGDSEVFGKDSATDGQDLVLPREDTKVSGNDSGSDAGMGSIHSQDSGIGNASVVIETWV